MLGSRKIISFCATSMRTVYALSDLISKNNLEGVKLSPMVESVRFKSRRKNPEEPSKLVKMASQAYLKENHDLDSEAPPIVILHGLLGSKTNWHTMAKNMVEEVTDRRIMTVDIRNHGDSAHTKEFTYEILVSDLLKFLFEAEIERASLIGHSMGGRICMLLAMMYPKMVHSLVIVDISPVNQSPNLHDVEKLFKIMKRLDLDPYYTLKECRKQARLQLLENGVDETMVNFLLLSLVSDNGRKSNWRWKFNVDSLSKNFKTEICRFPFMGAPYMGPTLFVSGADSDYLRPSDEEDVKRVFPTAKFEYILEAGHWVHSEKPKEFLELVTEFHNKHK